MVKWDHIKLKDFRTKKENVFKLKRPPTEENIQWLYIRKRTDNQNIQEA
jgi:hypothetical protein